MRGGGAAAFSLIELLIVVGIIAILAAIAVPNFLDAQVRSRVSRVKTDMRSLATAIESYHVDHNDYPVRRFPNANIRPEVPHANARIRDLRVLTTPVAYISSLFPDVFETRLRPPNNLIDYWDPVQSSWFINRFLPVGNPRRVTPEKISYLIVSVGPDGFLHPLQPALYGWPHPPDPGLTLNGLVRRVYDPTNGTNSVGNIYYNGAASFEGTSARILEALR